MPEMRKQAPLNQDLGDGLILRLATEADAQALAEFNSRIHSDFGPDKPDEQVAAWTSDLLVRPHPTFKPGDFTLVEDTRAKKIVSSLNLIPQRWTYGGISFGVGRPELVGTDPDYRNRGLVRRQFDLIHQWCLERELPIQAITGIPYYYRLFGYEMAMDLGGGRRGSIDRVIKLRDGQEEPYQILPAQVEDLPFIASLDDHASHRYPVNCQRDLELWRYELDGKSDKNVNRSELKIITRSGGDRVGYLAHSPYLWKAGLTATTYELLPGVSWAQVTQSVVRYLVSTGKQLTVQEGKDTELPGFAFWLGQDHPVYHVLHDTLPYQRKPYAWYLRVPDLPAFLTLVRPVLNNRLKESYYAGHSKEIKITFYHTGIKLVIENGIVNLVEPWQPAPVGHAGDAAFPGLTFLQLLFGYRSFEELNYAFADCWWEDDETFGLLNALFPKQPVNIWPIS